MNIFLLISFAFILEIPFSRCNSIEFPLKRVKTIRQFLFEKDISLEQLELFDNKPKPNDTIPIIKYFDTDFYGEITIGSNRQPFKMFLDIAWGDTYVPSVFCPYRVISCQLHNKYDSRKSLTYIRDGQDISFDKFKGFYSIDTFHVGHSNIYNQSFIELTDIAWTEMFTVVDGTLGLGFQSLAHTNKSVFLVNFFQHANISRHMISFYFNRDETSEHGGVLIFGTPNNKHYNGTFQILKSSDPYFWKIPVGGVYMDYGNDTFTFCEKRCNAILDSNKNAIAGPFMAIETINRMLGATEFVLGRYAIPCDSVVKLNHFNFTIGAINITLHGNDIALKVSKDFVTVCLSIFVVNDYDEMHKNDWILGIPFFKRSFLSFYPESVRVGIARGN